MQSPLNCARRVVTTAGFFILAASPALAYLSSAGHVYIAACNEHGMVLESAFPVGRFQGTGAFARQIVQIETLYLGIGCDAYSDVFGEGSWGWANGGFLVAFEDIDIGFPRQEVYCPEDGPQPALSPCSM